MRVHLLQDVFKKALIAGCRLLCSRLAALIWDK